MGPSPTPPLTGRDAVEALSLVTKLGNSNARFDARRVSAALRFRAGRVRIMAGLALRVLVPGFHVETRRSHTPRRAPRRAVRAARGTPDLPRPSASSPDLPRQEGS